MTTTASQEPTEPTDLQFPTYNVVGQSKMHDGREVMIMEPVHWDQYIFRFNKLNDREQPADLVARLQHHEHVRRREQRLAIAQAAQARYEKSLRGVTNKSLYPYFLKFVIPIVFCLAIYEDLCSLQSPRREMWKGKLGMPDLAGFLNFEVVNVIRNQDKGNPKKKEKSTQVVPKDAESSEGEDEGNEGDEGEHEEAEEPRRGRGQRRGSAINYWENLEFLEYDNKTEAEEITFKELMQTHIRFYHPGIFRELILDQPAVANWNNLTYLIKKLEGQLVEGVHYAVEGEMKLYAPIRLMAQRGIWQPFSAFIDEYLAKFTSNQFRDPRDLVNLLWQQPFFEGLKEDIEEPNVLNKVLNFDHMAWNAMSQGAQTLPTSIKQDRLHCTVSGRGERVTLVSAFQNHGMRVGEVKHVQVPGFEEEGLPILLPNDYSFVNINHEYPPQEELQFLQPLHADLAPGDCVYIPAYWWHQIKAEYPQSPRKTASKAKKDAFTEELKPLSLSVDFWYEAQSGQLENLFYGIKTGLLR